MSLDAAAQAALARLRAKVPDPPKPPNPNTKGRREWKPDFLAAYADRASVKDACAIVGIGRTTVYEARIRDPEFAGAWDLIEHDVVALLEQSALQRALDGDARLTEFLLKAHRPSMYRDSLRVDGKITVVNEAQLDEEIEDFLAREREELDATGEGEAARGARVPIVDAPSAPAPAPAV